MAKDETPDVFVGELPTLPPSVVEVETAIPAFIGYTEKALETAADDLLGKPTRVHSLSVFEQYFGGALGGATPGEAFFVRCGLGTTMNDQDIFDGLLNVEFGMAVVRPAEFIILRISHRSQTS